jgi:hypothetical protein
MAKKNLFYVLKSWMFSGGMEANPGALKSFMYM